MVSRFKVHLLSLLVSAMAVFVLMLANSSCEKLGIKTGSKNKSKVVATKKPAIKNEVTPTRAVNKSKYYFLMKSSAFAKGRKPEAGRDYYPCRKIGKKSRKRYQSKRNYQCSNPGKYFICGNNPQIDRFMKKMENRITAKGRDPSQGFAAIGDRSALDSMPEPVQVHMFSSRSSCLKHMKIGVDTASKSGMFFGTR